MERLLWPSNPSRGLSGMQMSQSCSEILKDVLLGKDEVPRGNCTQFSQVSCVYLCILGGVCTCAWRSEDNFRCHSSGAVYSSCEAAPLIGLERQLSSQLAASSVCLSCLSPVLPLLGFQVPATVPDFLCRFLGIEFRSSWVWDKHFVDQPPPPLVRHLQYKRAKPSNVHMSAWDRMLSVQKPLLGHMPAGNGCRVL